MEKLFLQFLNMSLTGSYVILVVILVRLLLKKAPKSISYVLWCAALFRLVCPFSFESVLSLLPSVNPLPQELLITQGPAVNGGIPVFGQAAPLPAMVPGAGVSPTQTLLNAGAVLWLVGVVALTVYSAVSYLLLKRRVSSALLVEDNIFECGAVASPFVLGVIGAKIYLPVGLNLAEKSYIIKHEQFHIKRRDHVVKLLAFLVVCFHWFNPLVWLGFALMCKDMEMSCDEAVIKQMGGAVKQDYSKSLLSLAVSHKMLSGSPLAFGESNVRARIKNVLNYRRPAFWVVIVGAIAVTAACVGLMSNPLAQRESMKWARGLDVGEIERIELVVMPSSEQSRYRSFEPAEFEEVVRLINQSRGRYVAEPEMIYGSGIILYVTTMDGVRHTVSNNASVYLEIDGESFKAGYNWLGNWPYQMGDSALPEHFYDEAGQAAGDSEVLTDEVSNAITSLWRAANDCYSTDDTDKFEMGDSVQLFENAPEFIELKNYDAVVDGVFTAAGKTQLESVSVGGDATLIQKRGGKVYRMGAWKTGYSYAEAYHGMTVVSASGDRITTRIEYVAPISETDAPEYGYADLTIVKVGGKWLVEDFQYPERWLHTSAAQPEFFTISTMTAEQQSYYDA